MIKQKSSFTSDTSEEGSTSLCSTSDEQEDDYIGKDRHGRDDDHGPLDDSVSGTTMPTSPTALLSATGAAAPPSAAAAAALAKLRFVPKCLRFEQRGEPLEATGLAVDYYARGPILMASMVLGPALLELASQEAGCNPDGVTGCAKVYGFRPSSLLSNLAIVTGLVISILMPFFGAIVDHTPYRRQIAATSAAILTLIKAAEVMVGPKTWFIVTILQVFSACMYNAHATATSAYTSELSANTSKQARFNSYFNVVLYASMLFFLAQVMTVSSLFHVNDVGMARISQCITGITSACCFYYAWKNLFHNRPALSQVPAGGSIWTCGFKKVFCSAKRIHERHKVLRSIILSLVFAEAGLSAITTVATTYLSKVLGMKSSEIVLVFFLCLLFGGPGSALGGVIGARFGAVTSALTCHFGLILVTGSASIYLTDPDQKPLAYFFAAMWGVFTGWLPPMNVTMFISVMPTDSRAEYMGIYMLSTSILSWLPPLVFTALNEHGINMAFGLGSLVIYFSIGVVFLLGMGRENYRKTVAEAELNNSSTCGDYAHHVRHHHHHHHHQELVLQGPPRGSENREDDVEESSSEVRELI
jgi:MFS transporter, UMF1 family